ncbi:MAG: oligopeptide:H+ symporter [Gemmataceae bacterium]|nr:oligopeptide:H+ symporter [Gemmataceae bacterium]
MGAPNGPDDNITTSPATQPADEPSAFAETAPPPEVAAALEPQKTGFWHFIRSHPTGFWFIFWGEFAERCSYYGMRAILATYMADQLGFGDANAGTYFSLFVAACYFLPLVGGYIADNFLGKYNTIVWFSVPYILGHVILGFETPLFLFIALTLLAMGSGVIKPNISTLMGLTYDQQRPGQEQLRSSAFGMFYMAINIGAFISQLAIPWIRTRYDSYWLAFLFPAILMAVAFVIFAAGKKYYAVEVITRRKKTPEEFMLQWQVLGRIGGLFLLVMFFWAMFDQTASTWIFFARTYMDLTILPGVTADPEQIQALNPLLIVIFLPLMTYLWVVLDRRGRKVRATDKMVLGFALTALALVCMTVPGYLAGPKEKAVALVKAKSAIQTPERISDRHQAQARERFADELVARVARERNLSDPKKLETLLGELGLLAYSKEALNRRQALPAVVASTAGLLASPGPLTSLTPLAAAASVVPPRTLQDYVRPENRVTVWWQALAYLLLTIAEILISVTGLELAFVAAPKTMKSFVTAVWLLTVFLANLVINAPVAQLYPVMNPGDYFGMLTIMMVVVTGVFVVVARRFNQRMAEAEAQAALAAVGGATDGQPPDEHIQERRPS